MSKMLRACGAGKSLSSEEQRAKINDVKKMLGAAVDKFPAMCCDASILRYLRARNWNAKKAAKMLKETLKWRLQFKPEKLRWEDIAHEARTGKIYKANYVDKKGRTILVVRPGFQNTNGVAGQLKHLVYSIENALKTMNPGQEQLVWLVSFELWTMACISVKVARETLKILQDHYPERLGAAILYNPPKVFESFWTMMKPFIERKTYKKVNFVYSNEPKSKRIMEELFDMEKLDSAFGGRNSLGFDFEAYGLRMKQEDKKLSDLHTSESALPMLLSTLESHQDTESLSLEHEDSDEDDESSSSDEATLHLEFCPDKPDEVAPNLELDPDKRGKVTSGKLSLDHKEETQDQSCK